MKNGRVLGLLTLTAIVLGAALRISMVSWQDPWGPHHPDEHLLPLDAIALWEGVTPREVGWPASTTRLILSAIAGVQFLAEQGGSTWDDRDDPPKALEGVARWIGVRYADPVPLYRLGRWVSVATGILQLVAVAWALKQWSGPLGVFIGTLASAMAPLMVVYSQYVLADITALLFATVVLGVAARPTIGRVLAMAALGGLATASKFHFGLWMLTPIVCALLMRELRLSQRLALSLAAVTAGGLVIVALVPWFWLDPFLAAKEFGGVVAVKVGSGASAAQIAQNVTMIFGGLGTIGWLGMLSGLVSLRGETLVRMLSILTPLVLGAIALTSSAVVFDRYGLVLAPGIALLCALGWESLIDRPPSPARSTAAVALAAAIVMTGVSLVQSQQVAREFDVDVLAKRWVLEHVPRGQRVAVFDEVNAFLPRASALLDACARDVTSPESYVRKWAVLGYDGEVAGQPMRSMLLTDEEYRAYWCRRERLSQTDRGYNVIPFHGQPRFGSLLESDVIREFRSGEDSITGRIDVLVVNREVDAGRPPAVVLRTARGQRVIYVR
jgi:hypothetical protein